MKKKNDQGIGKGACHLKSLARQPPGGTLPADFDYKRLCYQNRQKMGNFQSFLPIQRKKFVFY